MNEVVIRIGEGWNRCSERGELVKGVVSYGAGRARLAEVVQHA